MTKKLILPIIFIVLMAIGYAAISTSFFLDGTLGIEQGLFDVRFTSVIAGGTDLTNDSVSEDGKKFTYLVTDSNRVTYEVTNLSKDYDIEVNVICSITPETIVFKNNFNNKDILIARTSRNGNVLITLPETTSEVITLTCILDIAGLERTEPGSENIEAEKVDYLRIAESFSSATTYLGHTLDKSKVKSITLKDTKEVPEGIESWDVSNAGNGSILAYTLDEDSDSMLELYIGQDGGVNANPNSSYLFQKFTNATSINGLEYLDTSNITDMSYMFYNCSNLTSLDVSNWNIGNVKSMERTFEHCNNLITLDVSKWNTSNIRVMYRMFNACTNLTMLDVSKWDTSNVSDMEEMFFGCSNLKQLDVSHFDTSKVKSMSSMFSSCSGLTNLDVSGFDTSNVTTMEGMFSRCSGLTNLDASGFNTSNVMNMRSMFFYCSNLTTLDVSGFDTSNVTTMQSMFSRCSGLTNLDASGFNTSNVMYMDAMFSNCSNLTSLDVSGFNTGKATNMSSMFSNCNKLTSLDISEFDTSNVTYMSSMFSNCINLTSLDVSKLNTSNVISMSFMFYNCSRLTSLDVSRFDTSQVTDMRSMFNYCSKLTASITIRGTTCTAYDSMFSNAATSEKTKITVNYTEDASDLVDQMIATKSSSSNVIKGTVVQ